jgi:hypothetical protein
MGSDNLGNKGMRHDAFQSDQDGLMGQAGWGGETIYTQTHEVTPWERRILRW